MLETITPKPKWWLPGLCALLFFSTGLPFLHYPGLQNDEVLFATQFYHPGQAAFGTGLKHHRVPLMIMSYIGSLKTWLYAPILKIFPPSYLAIRVPVLLLGSLTVWILFLWLAMVHGERAAWIAALLLATDTMFLLTTCFDWGPVALQHFLTLLGVALVVHFHQRRNRRALAWGFFCFGLAAWDKALFAWIFAGLILGVLLVFSGPLWRTLSWRNSLVATLSLVAGASPLIVYNVHKRLPTFHAASGFTIHEMYPKTFVLRATWEGIALSGYLVKQDAAPEPRGASNLVEAASLRLRALGGEHRRNGLNWAAFTALALLLPSMLWPASRPLVLFCLIVIIVAWLQMAVTRGAGAAAHHAVLLWPFPHVILAVLFAEASRRLDRWGLAATGLAGTGKWLLGIGMVFLIGWNVLVTNQYLYQFLRNGSAGSWSDAIYPLWRDLHQMRQHGQPNQIAVVDWGILIPLDVLEQGQFPLVWTAQPFEAPAAGEPPRSPNPALLRDPGTLWISHTDGNEQFAGVNARFAAFLQRTGWRKLPVRTYYDSTGRAVLESFRLQKK